MVEEMNKINVSLDHDQLSEIVRQSLIEDYNVCLVHWPYDEEGRSEKLLEAIKEVIDYYSTPEQFAEWKNTLTK